VGEHRVETTLPPWAVTCQTRIADGSTPPAARWRPSGLQATAYTQSGGLAQRVQPAPPATSQTLTARSAAALARSLPSGLKHTP